ncbi:kelch repeat and BTB domain-containing protein 8-like [Daktulosphaira vitifoliae]|uniref:kelch repeat and BTB domain-containing protein 8-like n=1 Tax=Daktulosphaira vitifoliae TaxID=58002 RepID=UPI0021AAD820|nr:kelch repeat and BTB domain-containing protein 8-like [Daktulosphaira vitifoliae]
MNTGNEQLITLCFDNGDKVVLEKLFLIKNSLYFEAMFSGQFLESHSGKEIPLKDISHQGFVWTINCLKTNSIVVDSISEFLILLETSQILQFNEITKKCTLIIEKQFLFSSSAIQIFSLTFKLGLNELFEKARIYILYYFKTLIKQFREEFLKLTEEDLYQLLCDNGLNVEKEVDVFDLIIEWSTKANKQDVEYEVVLACVHFNAMNKQQLEYCITKTKNQDLKNKIEKYLKHKSERSIEMEKSGRHIPYVLCGIKNEENGHAYIHCWDWNQLKFIKFLQLDPLPLDTTGYHVVVKDMDIFILAGEIGYGRGQWNETGWKYNMITKQWSQLKNFVTTKRRHGVGYFCGNELYLIGGLTKHRLPNELMERFNLDQSELKRVRSYLCNFTKKVDRKIYTCLEYKSQLVMITKERDPIWFYLCHNRIDPTLCDWGSRPLHLNAIIICAITNLDNVYMLAYNNQFNIILYCYCPVDDSCQDLVSFKAIYDQDSIMCSFNGNKAMVFTNNTLECYNIDNKKYREYPIHLDSFHSNYFFNIPIY